jgi:cytochrome c
MTKKKEIANWMSMHLMQAIKPADGSPMKCSSCHTDSAGRPVAKILGDPRDPVKANEWMNLVMVRKFVAADGSKLKCKSCHVGAPGTAEFQKTVILRPEQLPPHAVGAKGTQAF